MDTYLIIRAFSGIGKRLSLQLSQSGHQVFGTYHTKTPNSDVSGIHFFPLNVLDDAISVDFLPERLDGFIYCPGSITLRPFERIKPVDFLNDYNLQVVGAIKIIQVVASRLKASRHAAVILFSTVAVQTGFPFHALVSASKGAIESLTRALAAEYAPKIRINAIAPSLTDTPLSMPLLNTDQKRMANAERHPLKRIGTADDIANMAEFLLSPKANWITGQIFHIDGGLSSLRV